MVNVLGSIERCQTRLDQTSEETLERSSQGLGAVGGLGISDREGGDVWEI